MMNNDAARAVIDSDILDARCFSERIVELAHHGRITTLPRNFQSCSMWQMMSHCLMACTQRLSHNHLLTIIE